MNEILKNKTVVDLTDKVDLIYNDPSYGWSK